MAGMKRTFMPRSLAQNRERFCALMARNDGTQGAMVRSMNGWPFMRPRLPEKPEPEGAQYAPSSSVARSRMEPMKARLMQWRLPEKPASHCEPQSQFLSRHWVKNGLMKTPHLRWTAARSSERSLRRCQPDERAGHDREKKEMGMTPTPPQAGGEAARGRARWLLAPTPPRESCAVRGRAVALLDTEPGAERQPGGRKGEMKVR